MKKTILVRLAPVLFCLLATITIIFFACKRENFENNSNKQSKAVTEIRNWWETEKQKRANDVEHTTTTTSSKINSSIGQWWAGEFENGTPQWDLANTFTVGNATIYEVPFLFPDGLTMLNYPSTMDPRSFIDINKTMSKTYLLISSQSGREYASEFMSIVSNVDYLDMLDSTRSPFPDFHITNVFPGPSRLGNFRGSFKFFDIKGHQMMEEKFLNGNIVEYTPYGDIQSSFAMNPSPVIFPLQLTELSCWETVHYTTVCGTGEYADLCTTTINSVSINCTSFETIGGGDSNDGGGSGLTGGGGGGVINPPAPAITPVKSPKGLSCNSFTFMSGPGNWQEAGLKNYRFKIRLFDPTTGYMTGRIITITQTLYFGLPKVYGDGSVLTPGAAAAKAAKAVDIAGNMAIDFYANYMRTVTDAQIQQKFRDFLQIQMIYSGGTIAARPSISNCVVNSTPSYYTFWSDDCQ